MQRRKLIAWFVLQVLAQVAHIIEELLGRMFVIDIIGVPVYLVLTCLMTGFIVLAFVECLKGKRWAYRIMIVYSLVMIVNGIGHNLAPYLIGDRLGSLAGEYTGLVLIVLSPIFLVQLIKWRRSTAPGLTNVSTS